MVVGKSMALKTQNLLSLSTALSAACVTLLIHDTVQQVPVSEFKAFFPLHF